MATDLPSASTTGSRREHALHNERVCNYLVEAGEYNDWVVTTAFYAALHWIEHYLFPYTIPYKGIDQVFNDINHYAVWLKRESGDRTSKHVLRLELVRDNCKGICASYQSLYDNCMSARYRDYRVSQKLVVKARKSLKQIHEFCDQDATS